MWWAGREYADVYLSLKELVLLREGASGDVLEHHQIGDRFVAMELLGAWRKSLPTRTRVRVWVSGGLCRPMLLKPMPDLRNDQEVLRAAELLARRTLHLSGPLQLWLEPAARKAAARVLIACPEDWLQDIVSNLRGAGQLRSIQPLWAAVLSASLRWESVPQVLGLVESDAVTALAGSQGNFDLVESTQGAMDVEAARDYFGRTLLDLDEHRADAATSKAFKASGRAQLYRMDWSGNGGSSSQKDLTFDTAVPFARWMTRLT